MGVYKPVHIALILRRLKRHVAICALLWLWRIVKRPCTLSRNAARLPVVVLVESTQPAVAVNGHIQMHFVTGGAEFGRLRAHERLEEYAPVGLRIQLDHEV